jgi:hypothetical protein
MTDDVEATVAAARRELVEPWATLFAAQRFYGEKVRKQTLQAYGRLCDAHLLITGVLAAALLRINGKIVPIDWAHEERKALVALFVIGLEVCENAIVQGRYLQSLVLLRQEMEIIARIKTVGPARGTGSDARISAFWEIPRLHACTASCLKPRTFLTIASFALLPSVRCPGTTYRGRLVERATSRLSTRGWRGVLSACTLG